MKIRTSRVRAVGACVVAMAAVSLVGAGSASAQWVPATWTPGSGTVITQKGDLTVKLNGGSPVVCRVGLRGQVWGHGFASSMGAQQHLCANGSSLYFSFVEEAEKWAGAFRIRFTAVGYGSSPYGYYTPQVSPQPFVNAAGATPSRIVFNSTPIGTTGGGQITATGSLEVKTDAGGTVTLN